MTLKKTLVLLGKDYPKGQLFTEGVLYKEEAMDRLPNELKRLKE